MTDKATVVIGISDEALADLDGMARTLVDMMAHPETYVVERVEPTADERLMLDIYHRLRERLWRFVE